MLFGRKRWNRWRISAPKLTVRARVPWYWHAFVIIAVAALGITVALWTYDAGRRFGGPNTEALESEIANLRRRVAELESEAQGLRAAAVSNESRLQIEKTAAVQLARQLKAAEGESARLREDLAFFDNLAVRDAADGRLTITGFK